MALHTPRQRNGLQSSLARPSFGNTNSSPSLRASAQDVNRKASLQALSGSRTPTNRMDAADLDVGDAVTVPGDMYGTVRFVGSVKGKSGKFVGVELDREFAARGKNDGDVDGINYFHTTIPGAGIFLPVHRAEKRLSPNSLDSFPNTPNTPSYSTNKFSQTIGHGAVRPSSPQFKPKRPSLPRPESPLRRPPPNVAPTPGRGLSASVRGGSRPGMPASTPSKMNMRQSTTSRPSTAQGPEPPRSYSRTGSRLGQRNDGANDYGRTPGTAKSGRNPSGAPVPSYSQPLRSGSRMGSGGTLEDEILRLRTELAERDKRLAEQAANLADMDASVKELSGLLPPDGIPLDGRRTITADDTGDQSTAQLRQLLREKNEKITILTSEFDAHRADFRSTLDSLEMASTETERVYEEQKRDLIAQVQDLTERMQEMEEMNGSRKEFEDVANQLKGLEEFVQELEEGLEDARRGEAEARGEVEFLRGEVERGRSELKREREKASATVNGHRSSKNLEEKDNEIRGLKAIIHSFSTNPETAPRSTDVEEVSRLQNALKESQAEKERLETELEQLRRDTALKSNGHATANSSNHTRNESELTAVMSRGDKSTFAEHARKNGKSSEIFCEMCDSAEHDTLDCENFQSDGGHPGRESNSNSNYSTDESGRRTSAATSNLRLPAGASEDVDVPAPLSPRLARRDGVKKEVEEKWCALCEKDGHLAYECPDEQY
ncbi:unnamed protein product [Zymoseptoria tritici ST99CH_3D1]|nr:unnamed protein product [Zymoseptoria tritici ST99CH_3D1]